MSEGQANENIFKMLKAKKREGDNLTFCIKIELKMDFFEAGQSGIPLDE